MKVFSVSVLAVACLLAVGLPGQAQTSFPMLNHTYPTVGQRGQTLEVTITGVQNFAGAGKVLFGGRGVTATVVQPATPPTGVVNTITMRVTIERDAEPGVHEFRVLTPRGVSSLGLFVVGDSPEALENEPNNAPAQAQAVTLPVTMNGRVQSGEDIDCFKLTATEGQSVAFHVLSSRLQDKIHDLQTHIDPIISVLDSSGRELAGNDDFFKADPYLVYTFARAGDYVVQIRDVRYSGNGNWVYRLTMTQKPYLTAVHPMGVKRGTMADLELIGTGMGMQPRAQAVVKEDMPLGPQLIQVATPNGMSNAVPVYVSDFPATVESEGNDDWKTATAAPVPSAISGRMDRENDLDYYRFTARKDQAFNFEVVARRLDSLLDSQLAVVDSNGRELNVNDDFNDRGLTVPDSAITGWRAPADGEYGLLIRDLHNRGGENFGYVILSRLQEPDMALRCDPDKAMIGPGGHYPMFVRVERRGGLSGEVKVLFEGLPKGVTATDLTIPSHMDSGVVILQAATDAPNDAANIQVVGVARIQQDGKEVEIRRVATPMQEIYLPGGGRGLYPIQLNTVSVTQPQDILIETSPREVTLTPGGSATIEVTIKRNNYTKPVTVDVILRHLGGVHASPLPPGVTITDLKIIGENQDKTIIELKAAADAKPISNWPIAVMGQISVNFVVKTSYSAPPLLLTVKSP